MPYGLFRTSYLCVHYGRCETCAMSTQHPTILHHKTLPGVWIPGRVFALRTEKFIWRKPSDPEARLPWKVQWQYRQLLRLQRVSQ